MGRARGWGFGLPVGLEHGTDDEPAAGSDTRDRNPRQVGERTQEGSILDELCATTGWHRNPARKALAQAPKPKIVRPRKPRAPKYEAGTIATLRFCWAVLVAPAGKRLLR